MTAREQVVSFLNLFKSCVSLGHCEVMDREKNRQGLIDLGMTAMERQEVLLGLEPEDYVSGPEPDDTDSTKNVWKFGKAVGGAEVYIKLRVAEPDKRNGAHHALVWSFHLALSRLNHPLRGGAS